MTERIVVLVTCGSVAEGRRIGRALVERKLAACVNVVSAPVESIYRWKGKVDTAKEFLLIIKTARSRFKAVEEAVKRLHSYDIPEIIALSIEKGSREYLAWLSESVHEEWRGEATARLRKDQRQAGSKARRRL